MSHATLTPAYGRDFKSKSEIDAALLEGKDFILHTHTGDQTYINLEQLIEHKMFAVNVRYKKNMSVHVIADVRKLKSKAEKPIKMFGVFLWKQSGHFEASEALFSYKGKAAANKKCNEMNADATCTAFGEEFCVREFTPAPKPVAMPRSVLNRSALADILGPDAPDEPKGF